MPGRARAALATAAAWSHEGRRVAVATVVSTERSAPRPVGTQMVIDEDGRVDGMLSGGCVEQDVARRAVDVIARDRGTLTTYAAADELGGVGLPCGGSIDVWIEPYSPGLAVLAAADAEGASAARAVDLATGRELCVLADSGGSRLGSLGDDVSDRDAVACITEQLSSGVDARATIGNRDVFMHVSTAPPQLMLIGATDIAEHLTELASRLGWQTTVIDPRTTRLDPDRYPTARALVDRWPQHVIGTQIPVDPRTAVIALSHDHRIDEAAIRVALHSRAMYVGALGARTLAARRRAALIDDGFTVEAVARLVSPIGLDLGGAGPAETALSIMAELVAVARGRSGGRLASAVGPIHAPRASMHHAISR